MESLFTRRRQPASWCRFSQLARVPSFSSLLVFSFLPASIHRLIFSFLFASMHSIRDGGEMGLRKKKFWVGEYASRESNPGLVQVFCALVATWSSRDQGESQATSGIHNWCTKSSYPLFRGGSWPGGGGWGRGGLLRFPNHFGGGADPV